jgi:ABC-2 type transport system ATP-binding protein
LISIEHLTRRFHDVVAVDDVCLEVPRGQILGFLGPNGAGKTTTIRILTGFLPASSGRAAIDGLDVATSSLEVRQRIGYLPESVPLPPDARVDEYLEFRARLKGISAKARPKAYARVLGLCGLESMRRRILGQLSRGYRQRVGLADALIADPPVLILDEPTGGLDPEQRQEVLDLVAQLAGKRTVLLSSHVLTEVEHACTQVAIIKTGRIVAAGTREELEADAGHQGEVEIAAAGAGDELAAWLTEHDLPILRRPTVDSCVVHLPDDSESASLLAALVRAEVAVSSFRPLRRSLHEIFLDLTRSPAA